MNFVFLCSFERQIGVEFVVFSQALSGKRVTQQLLNFASAFSRVCFSAVFESQFPHRYVGDWENDLQHGQGTFYFADGACFQGLWVQVYNRIP